MRIPGHQRKSYAWRWTAALAGLAVLTVALVMAIVVTPTSRVEAATFRVNNLADTGGDCPTTTTCTLRQAIKDANDAGGSNTITISISGGGTIHLAGNLPTITDDSLTITGQTSVTVEASVAMNGLTINADGVKVSNLKFDGSGGTGAGLDFQANAGGATITNVTIQDFSGIGGNGILLEGNNDSNTFTGCTVKDNGNGITLANNSDGNAIKNTTVEDNTAIGINVSGAASDDNSITGATIKDNGGYGVDVGAGHDNSVHTSTVSDNLYGVWATGATRLVVDSSTIEDNTTDGLNLATGHDTQVSASTIKDNSHHGVVLVNESGTVVENSTLSGSDDAQIQITGAGTGTIQILSNAIAAGSDGIVVDNLVVGNIEIGTAVAYCNVFSGTLTQANPLDGDTDDWYLQNDSADNIHASYNDWNGNTGAGVSGVICAHNATNHCGTGDVDASNALTSCAGAAATPTPTPIAATATAAAAATATAAAAATATAAAATSTPTATATPLPAAATATAAAAATATAAAGAMESVTLVAGCNPVASTYPDGTPITTIANAVSPSGVLISIWKFDTGTSMWLGYSPNFPQASDLTAVNRLDAIFICVSSAATLSRPII